MGSPLALHWTLDPGIDFLNHGSFGACPRPVFERYQAWQRELEHEPVDFLDRRLSGLLDTARSALAGYTTRDEIDRLLTALARELDAEKRQEHE